MRAHALREGDQLRVGKYSLARARTFSDVPKGSGFCYENANGLVEIAVNCGRADRQFDLAGGRRYRSSPKELLEVSSIDLAAQMKRAPALPGARIQLACASLLLGRLGRRLTAGRLRSGLSRAFAGHFGHVHGS